MSSVCDIEGNLASPDIVNAILEIYSNLPIQDGIDIYIKGETELINGFLKNVENIGHEIIACNMGYEYIKFIVLDNDNNNKFYTISTSNYDEELENILINYV
jgi:hypothetical protein